MKNIYFIYILTNTFNTVFYTGITNNIERRIYEHKNKVSESFTKKYNINKLIYFEEYLNVAEAIKREKQVKSFSRKKKLALIRCVNPYLKEITM